MTRVPLRAVALVLALLVVLAFARQAGAHASLIKSEPADGAVVAQAPVTLRLTFNEPVAPLVLRLIGPGSESIALGEAVAEDKTITIAAARALQRGTHVLSWRVVSADGHPVAGSLIFSIGAPSAPPTADLVGDGSVRAALWTAKLVIYAGLFIGVGGAFFRAWIADPDRPAAGWSVQRALVAVLAAGLIATLLSVGLQGLDALDLPLSGLQCWLAWKTGLETSYGLTAVAASLALLAGLFSLAANPPLARICSSLGMLGVGFALALSGHAATAAPRLLTAPSVFVHGICVAFWIGSLLPLIPAMRHADAGPHALARFSRLIPYPLILLFFTGSALAIIQLARLDALWTTSYGIVLTSKLAVALALLALAAVNRYLLVPRFQSAGGAAARPLAISIACELALVFAILGLVALWRFTPPPRALVTTAPVSIHLHGEKAMAQVELVPEKARGARARVVVLDGEFRPLAAKEVTLVVSNAAAGIEPLRHAAAHAADGSWRIEDIRIPVAGRWLIRIEILISDFDKVILEEPIVLPRAP
jgi:copper transport protein